MVVTDPQGEYRIPRLPAGTYTLRFERDDFIPYSRSALALRAQYTLRVNATVMPNPDYECLDVQFWDATTIDLRTTGTGVNVDADLIRNIPLIPGH